MDRIRHPELELERLWHHHRQSGDRRVRDRLVWLLTPIVRREVFARLAEIPGRRRVEEFLVCGLRALIETVDDMDDALPAPTGAEIAQHARERVALAISDELRTAARASDQPDPGLAPARRRSARSTTARSSAVA
ncbi:MAG TPA: hypothetical protein VKV27_05480 [Solirubrobacteraceae bacterium]|nr:hypothetical protein [Solirubrobacteraceae bacterium]